MTQEKKFFRAGIYVLALLLFPGMLGRGALANQAATKTPTATPTHTASRTPTITSTPTLAPTSTRTAMPTLTHTNDNKYSLIGGYKLENDEKQGLLYISTGGGAIFGCLCPTGTRTSIRTLVFVFVVANTETSFVLKAPDIKLIDLAPILVQSP